MQQLKLEIPLFDEKTRSDARQHLRSKSYKPKRRKNIIPNLKRNLKHGWLLPFLAQTDRYVWGRWDYWSQCQAIPEHAWLRWKIEPILAMMSDRLAEPLPRFVIEETLPAYPIPQIEWQYSPLAESMLHASLDAIPTHGEWQTWSAWEYVDFFLDWCLFGFGHPAYRTLPIEPSGCEGASMRLYQIFNLGILQLYPEDYLGRILPEICSKKGQRNQGFYPTPLVMTSCMSEIISLSQNEREDNRIKTFYEPACGTGAMMLAQSNHCLTGIGQDIDSTLLKCALFQFYAYAPWYAVPVWWLGNTDLLLGDSLDSSVKPKSMNAKYWQDEWFELAADSESKNEQKSEINRKEVIGSLTNNGELVLINDLPPDPTIQQVVKGERKRKGETIVKTYQQLNLF